MSTKQVDKGTKEVIRCAIYTRKSSDEGLDQDFNSLDAQREAAESFITSQKSAGWVCLPEQYNKGDSRAGRSNAPRWTGSCAKSSLGKSTAL